MTLKGRTRGIIFQVDLLNNVGTVSHRTTKFDRITHVGRGVFLGVTDAPTARGLGPSVPILGDSLPNLT